MTQNEAIALAWRSVGADLQRCMDDVDRLDLPNGQKLARKKNLFDFAVAEFARCGWGTARSFCNSVTGAPDAYRLARGQDVERATECLGQS